MTSTDKTHTGALRNGAAGNGLDRQARSRIANLKANAEAVAGDLPDPAAAGYLLLLFDQCRLYNLTHQELVEVFGRPLLAVLDLTIQAVEKLAARSGLGAAAQEDESPERRRRGLTPYQAARLRDLAGEYVGALPDGRAVEALLLLYDVLEVFELSPGQMETVFGLQALQAVTKLVYGEKARPGSAAPDERTQYNLPAESPVRVGGRSVPFFGTVGDGGHVTYTPEARLWLRYIGRPGDLPDAAEQRGGKEKGQGVQP